MDEQLRILKPYLRGFPLIVLAMIMGVLAAKRYLLYVTPMYESTAKLKLADVNDGVPSSNLFKDLDVFATANKIAAEIEVIRSPAMIDAVLDSLDFDLEVKRIGQVRTVELYHESPFLIRASIDNDRLYDKPFMMQVVSEKKFTLTIPDNGGIVVGTFGEVVRFSGGQMIILLQDDVIHSKNKFDLIDLYSLEFLSRSKLIRKIQDGLDVVSVDKDVPVIRISLKSPIPEKASTFVNQLANCYIRDYIETKYRAAHVTVNFLDERISDVSRKLTASEQSIQQYRDGRSITNLTQETETDLRKISQLKIQEANLRMSLDAIIELDAYMKKGEGHMLELAPNFEAFTDLLSTEIVKKIKQLQAEKRDLLLVYTPQDERVQVIDQKINDLGSYLQESIGNTRTNLQVKYDRLQEEIRAAESVFIGIPEKERMLTILNRQFGIYERSYNFLNEKKIEAEIAQAARIAFHRVIASATPSQTPVSPNRIIILIVAALLGMLGAMALIFFVHAVKAKVNDVHTIERNAVIPVAALTPYLRKDHERRLHFQKLAIELELRDIIAPQSMLVFTSSAEKEGREYILRNLADALMAQGRRMLLVRLVDDIHALPVTLHAEADIDILELSAAYASSLTRAALEGVLQAYRSNYEVTLVDNQTPDTNAIAFLLMSVGTANLLILDARATPRKQIEVYNEWHETYAFPGMAFLLNRAGYNPNIVLECYQFAIRLKNQWRNRI